METISKEITSWLMSNHAIDEYDRELYEYAIYSMLITISPLLLVFAIGIVMGTFWEGIVLIIPFMCIRKYSGGYHAKHPGACFVRSCVILVMCMYLVSHMMYGWWLSLAMSVAVLSLCVHSPIDSENKRLDEEEKIRYRGISRKIAILFLMIHFLLVFVGFRWMAISIAIGIILSALLQILCILKFNNE